MTTHNLQADISEQANSSDVAEAQVIANFAWQHMKAACTFRDRVKDLEQAHLPQGFGEHFEEIRSYASACLMSTAASLEALINEFYISPYCSLRPKFTDFNVQFWGERGIERKPILAKYQESLRLLGIPFLNESSEVFLNAESLVELRNALVHYKPTWDPDRPKKASLTASLQGRYAISPFLSGREDFVTMQSMSSGCCTWAVNAAFQFIRAFDSITHLDNDKMVSFWRLEA